MRVDPQTGKLTRKCRKCKKFVDLKSYRTSRIRTCIPCERKRERGALAYYEHIQTSMPARATTPALTSTPEGMAKYKREYARDRAGPARPVATTPTHKLCCRCHERKPLSEFESQRVRICLACDGPPINV